MMTANLASADAVTIRGVILWPTSFTSSPFIVVQAVDGKFYSVAITEIERSVAKRFKSGDPVTVVGEPGARPHEITASSLVGARTVRGRLTWPRVLAEESTILISGDDGQTYGVTITPTTRVTKGIPAGSAVSVTGFTGALADRLVATSIQALPAAPEALRASGPQAARPEPREEVSFANPHDPSGSLGLARGTYDTMTALARVTLPDGSEQIAILATWGLAYDPATRRVVPVAKPRAGPTAVKAATALPSAAPAAPAPRAPAAESPRPAPPRTVEFSNPYDPTGAAPGVYDPATGIATVSHPTGGQQAGPLSTWALVYDPVAQQVVPRPEGAMEPAREGSR